MMLRQIRTTTAGGTVRWHFRAAGAGSPPRAPAGPATRRAVLLLRLDETDQAAGIEALLEQAQDPQIDLVDVAPGVGQRDERRPRLIHRRHVKGPLSMQLSRHGAATAPE